LVLGGPASGEQGNEQGQAGEHGLITAIVPQSWTCAPSGTIWIRATVAARPLACAAPSCTSPIQGSTPFTVTIAR
jgi:hypothetical protein